MDELLFPASMWGLARTSLVVLVLAALLGLAGNLTQSLLGEIVSAVSLCGNLILYLLIAWKFLQGHPTQSTTTNTEGNNA